MKTIPDLQACIRDGIDKLSFGEHPTNLYEPISYIMSLGGKRLRPMLVLLAYQLKRNDIERIVRPALAVEVFHNFTLMHDDIMDEAPLRRGQATVHEKWNNTVAILSGDTMLVKAYDLLLSLPETVLSEALKKFNQCATEVCEGQQIDMNFEELPTVTDAEYIEMIRLKTAVLLGFSLEFGGLMAGMDDKELKQLNAFGENMGIGFQLMDDLLDVYADQTKFGKQVGGDIVSNKKTYLLINALEMANTEQREKLNYWIGKDDFVVEEKVKAIKAIYDEIGIPNLTQLKIDHYFDKSFKILNEIEGDQSSKQVLNDFATQLMKRDR
ncbi:MAG: polyprenyl synthetase family protein [Cyclobacteriaceae bacterium]|nr:polyprenyl synthetase family protein [Cyclobacteriaceae bacterium HetDA_MAG_MS6]